MPAKVKKQQVINLAEALKEGTPNRRTIALQMVKDVLDESSFEASPGHAIPDAVGRIGRTVADKLVHGARPSDR
jgi:pyruvate dehydrogenase (quinone)/pyruvate oxidase